MWLHFAVNGPGFPQKHESGLQMSGVKRTHRTWCGGNFKSDTVKTVIYDCWILGTSGEKRPFKILEKAVA